MESVKIAVIGAGLVGLATAYRLNELLPDALITIVEKESQVGQHQSSHNSGVIHSGIYYTPGSLKAKNCIQGYHYLLDFCKKNHVDYKITGKLIVSINEEESLQLNKLYQRAIDNRLEGVRLLESHEIRDIEPSIVTQQRALWVPQTGIIDFFQLAQKFYEILQNKNVEFLLQHQVVKISNSSSKVLIFTETGSPLEVDFAVNCAGLFSDRIARMAGAKLEHRIIPFRGEYFQIRKNIAQKINGLVYPVPHPNLPFLGVHITKMINGLVEAGPNAVLAFKREGYRKGAFLWKDFWDILSFIGFWKMIFNFKKIGFSEWRKSHSIQIFTKNVQKILPEIQESDMIRASSGVRAQAIRKDGSLVDDFLLIPTPRMIHVCNAPSPAATSCLSLGLTIAEEVVKNLKS